MTLDVHKNHYIYEVKEKVFKKTGTPVDEMRLIFAGKSLENDRTLSSYNI